MKELKTTEKEQVHSNDLLCVLAEISSMCVGEITMGYKLDAHAIGEMIYNATGMTSPELRQYIKENV